MGLKTWITGLFASDGDRSPWGSFWFTPVATASMSGMRVNSDSALGLSAVYRAVALLSGHMAMFPVKFYEAGTRKRIQKHPILTLLNVRPNQWQNAYEWREMLEGHLELRGNAYNEIIVDGRGNITGLIPRHPDLVKIELLDNGDYRYRIKDANGTERVLPRGMMWHLRGLSSNGIVGLSVIEYARESMGLGLSAQAYGARFFANDAKPAGGWIEFPGKFKDKEARLIFRETWQAMQSGNSRGKTAILDDGMKYHEIGINNDEAQFLETRKFQISDIARWFGVPPHKIGDLDKATFSNIEQQALEYIQDALLPRAARWEASIQAELLFEDEEIDIEFDFRELLRGDSGQRSSYYHAGILDGWLTRNEARDLEGYEPIVGLDEPLRPLNMVEENEAEEEEADKEAAELLAQEAMEPKEDGEAARRLQALLAANASRVARRFMKAGIIRMEDAELIAEAIAVPLVKSLAWCTAFEGAPLDPGDEQTLKDSLIRLGKKP